MENITINPLDYLNEDDIKDLCRDIISQEIRQSVRNEESVNRIISNMAYRIVFDACQEKTGQDLLEVIEEKIPHIVENLNTYNVFSKPDVWDKEPSKGWIYLQEALDKSKSLIDERISELISQINLYDVQDAFNNSIEEAISKSILPRTN